MPALAPVDGESAAAFDDLAARLRSKAPNARAFDACVELVRANLDRTAAECERAEADAFAILAASHEAAAQRYLFAATAAAKRGNRQLPGTAAQVARVGVVGAGIMGLGIVRTALQAGLPATIVEPNDAARARAQGLLETAAAKYPPKAGEPGMLSLVTWGSSLDAMGECNVVIEAVFEDIDVKRDVFARLAEVSKPGAVLASNTSYLEVERIAAVVPDPERVLGMHFFSPAHVMRLVEVVRAKETGDDALRTAVDLAATLGKIPVVVRSSYGFVGNRMLARRSAQADALLLGGARPEQVDRVLTGFGFPMGPFAMADLAGLDVSWRNRQANGIVAPAADRLVQEGRLGQKVGRGFFRYQGRVGQPDPEVERIIDEVAAKHGGYAAGTVRCGGSRPPPAAHGRRGRADPARGRRRARERYRRRSGPTGTAGLKCREARCSGQIGAGSPRWWSASTSPRSSPATRRCAPPGRCGSGRRRDSRRARARPRLGSGPPHQVPPPSRTSVCPLTPPACAEHR